MTLQNLKYIFKYCNLIFCGFSTLLVAQPSLSDTGQLTVTGSSTIAPLMSEIGKRFEKMHPQTRIEVQTGGSSRGIADVRRNLADIGMVSRALHTDEKKIFDGHLVALDGISMIVHKTNPVMNLSKQDIINIYTGATTDWTTFGGPDTPITVVNKAEGRSTLEGFLGYVGLENRQIEADVIVGDNLQGIKTVAANPNAIGYVSIGTAEYEEAHGTAIRRVQMDGVLASTELVRKGEFEVARELNLMTKGTISPLAKQFIDFTQSKDVRDLIEAQYFVAVEKQ